MPISNLETYESWELDLPLLPERSRLYYLEPIAIGTACVEGLISYICRLAEAHCVSPGILAKQEILPSLRRIYTIGLRDIHEVKTEGAIAFISSFPKPAENKNPNEQGFLEWQYVEGLQLLTLRENLQKLTIPRWIEHITQVDQEIEIARNLRAWCPECLQQWRSMDQSIYEPLLWSIAAVTVCPYHCLPLQSRCPHCQKTQRPITGKMQVGRCSQCLNWLDLRSCQDSEIEKQIRAELDWHLWVTTRIMEVLAVMPNTPTYATKEMISSVVNNSRNFPEKNLENYLTKLMQWQLLKIFVH